MCEPCNFGVKEKHVIIASEARGIPDVRQRLKEIGVFGSMPHYLIKLF